MVDLGRSHCQCRIRAGREYICSPEMFRGSAGEQFSSSRRFSVGRLDNFPFWVSSVNSARLFNPPRGHKSFVAPLRYASDDFSVYGNP